MTEITAKTYEINKNCRRIHGDEEAIDIALAGIKEEFIKCCNYPNKITGLPQLYEGKVNSDAVFRIELTLERP